MAAIKGTHHRLVPTVLMLAIVCALGACKKDDAAKPAAGAQTTQQAAPAPTPESVVAANVSAMSVDQLRTAAGKAYDENRLYAPPGNNAMEYYLALRDKLPGDAGASSALTDLLPMAVIAADQGVSHEDFEEAKRLFALISKADANHPALTRLKTAIATKEAAALKRAETEKLTAEEEAKRKDDLTKQREEDQKKLQEQQRQQAALQTQQTQQAQEEQRRAAAAAEVERQRQAAAAAEKPQQQPTPQAQAPAARPTASNELHPISQPGPRYPAAAQRAGATANVQVEFTVGTDGSVTNARVVSNDAPRKYQRDFEREAVGAVKRWKFQPIGQATTSRRTISFKQ